MKSSDLIVGILSCEKTSERRGACRETWVKDLKELGIRCYFLIGNPSQDEQFILKDDILYLKCPDTYIHLPQKTHLFCKWAMGQDFTYVLKCDDDTYVYDSNLINYTLAPYDYIGTFSAGNYFSGAGYFLSHKAVQIIAKEMVDEIGAEDKLCGYYLARHGSNITWRKESKIKGWGNNLIKGTLKLKDPNTILDHYNRGELMIKKHAISKDLEYTDPVVDEIMFKSLQKRLELPTPTRGEYITLVFNNNVANQDTTLGGMPDRHIICICNVSVDANGDGELSLVESSSEEATGCAIECLNRDLETQWHTAFRKEVISFPHTLTLKLDSPQVITSVNIVPRQSAPKNGKPKDVSVFIDDVLVYE